MNAQMRRSANLFRAASEMNIEQRHVNFETKYGGASPRVDERALKQNSWQGKIFFGSDQN
jgi:hypothetical protein